MIEHEVKVLDINDAIVIKQLEQHGAQYMYTVKIRDRYYDTPHHSLAKQGQRLRIRSQYNKDNKTTSLIITKKTKYQHHYTKSMKEDDFFVEDREYAQNFLEKHLQLVQVKYKEKTRKTYKLDNFLFDFDYYKGLPPVLEVEGESPEKVEKMIRFLGLHFHPQVKRGSKRLFEHYGKTHL